MIMYYTQIDKSNVNEVKFSRCVLAPNFKLLYNKSKLQEMKLCIKDFFSKCDQIRRKLRI